MPTEPLKLLLIERLLRTEDESLLKQVAQLFRSSKDEVDEVCLPDEHFSITKEREAAYDRCQGKSYAREEAT